MAYYDALISAWTSPVQPPAGVTGTGLSSGMTTDQKLTAFNDWTVVGSAVPMIVATYQIYNLIAGSEFTALSSTSQQLVRDILGLGIVDASPGTQIRSRMITTFPSSTQTFANLSVLAANYDTPQIPWWRGNGYPERINGEDLANAGLS